MKRSQRISRTSPANTDPFFFLSGDNKVCPRQPDISVGRFFRLGEIEHLPVADNSVDVIISNCVINLSPEKYKVFDDAFRVLKAGGRLAVSDVVATAELPEEVKNDLALHAGCIAGASLIREVDAMLKQSGFRDIRIKPKDESREFIRTWAPDKNIENYVVSATIEEIKP